MIDFEEELNEMVAGKNLMNSYKLYFLKGLLVNVSDDKNRFSFYEMACWMCAYSFTDVCSLGRRIRPLDKLYDVAVFVIENEKLMESSKMSEVYEAVSVTDNKELRKLILALCDYVPYRLLAYLWPQELKGKTDRQKNKMIEESSRTEKRCIYSICSILQDHKTIEVNAKWVSYISTHRKQLILWIDQIIASFIQKG